MLPIDFKIGIANVNKFAIAVEKCGAAANTLLERWSVREFYSQ
jgi:hypothetical protein